MFRDRKKRILFLSCLFFCLSSIAARAEQELPFPDPDRTISMDFKDANLKDILKIFSMQSGLNFIASNKVQDKPITLYFDKVPIKEAMDELLRANELAGEFNEKANIVLVDLSDELRPETITKVFYLKNQTVANSSIKKETASIGGGSGGDLVAPLKDVLSKNGKITEESKTNSLIITDVPSRFPVIESLIKQLDIPIQQVMIDVEILDVNKNVVDKLGFSFMNHDAVAGDTPLANPLTLLVNGQSPIKGSAYMGNFSDIAGLATDRATNARQGSVTFGRTFLGNLDLLRSSSDTKYLARPRLLTLNNETAEISITKDEVIGKNEVTTISNGIPTTSTTFVRSTSLSLTSEGTGVFLKVTPHINSDTNEITMAINPKSSVTSASSIDANQFDAEVRSTKSIVKVKDGDTVVLGGLIHHDKQQTVDKVFLLGDIPLMGGLFRHKSVPRNMERELLVFITPHIVKDSSPGAVPATSKVISTREQDAFSQDNRQLAINSKLDDFEKKVK